MTIILTPEGYQKLVDELTRRKGALRNEIADSIKEAKEQGDLSENAEYSEAKASQNDNESRILALEAQLKAAEVVKHTRKSSKIAIGSTFVTKVGKIEKTFKIVGSNEVDPKEGKISSESPIGKLFMGRSAGDDITLTTPSGAKVVYAVTEVK